MTSPHPVILSASERKVSHAEADESLEVLKFKALQMWEEANPQLVQLLTASGELESILQSKAELALAVADQCRRAGLNHFQIEELVQEALRLPQPQAD